MSLTPALYDTYKRYKRGTEKFVTWLAESARKTGTVEDIFSAQTPPSASGSAPSGRLKGKARKETKAQTKKSQLYSVPLKHFRRLTSAIAGFGAVKMPDAIEGILQDVIEARRSCATWYKTLHSEVTQDSESHDGRHEHFIEVLKDVGKILNVLGPRTTVPGPPPAAIDAEMERLTNMFDYLEVEEPNPNEWLEGTAASKRVPKKPKDTYEIEPSDEYISFAIYCFLKDITDIRIFVRRTWREYKAHRVTLTTAATTTDAAIAMFRRLNDDFLRSFPRFEEHADIIAYLYKGYRDPNTGLTFTDKAEDFACYEADGVKLSTKTFFCDHTMALTARFLFSATLPTFGSFREFHTTNDEEALLKCISIYALLDERVPSLLDFDQLFQAISTIRRDRKMQTWTVFAVQLFVDTRRELRADLERTFKNFQETGKWLVREIDECYEFGKTNHAGLCHQANNSRVSQLGEKVVYHTVEDFFESAINMVEPKHASKYAFGAFYMLKQHPTLCGLRLHEVLRGFHTMGITIAGGQGCVLSVLHLYNAYHNSDRSGAPGKWEDLEFIIRTQGTSWLFVGDKPKDSPAYHRRLCLAFGSSATIYASDRLSRHPGDLVKEYHKGKRGGLRKLKFVSRLVELSVTTEGKEQVETKAAGDTGMMLELVVARALENIAASKGNNNARATRRPIITPLHSIRLFKETAKDDEFALRFSFPSLNRRCIELLRRIQRGCLEQSPFDYPEDEYGTDNKLNYLINTMFAQMAVCGGHIHPIRFPLACQALRDIMICEGDAETKAASARMGLKEEKADSVGDLPETTFDNPPEDDIPVRLRGHFANITFVGEDGSIRTINRGGEHVY